MANLASPLVASWKISEVDSDFHKEVEVYENKFPVLYDLIITSNELIMPIDAAVIHPSGVYLYCPNKSIDIKKGEKFLNEMLGGVTSVVEAETQTIANDMKKGTDELIRQFLKIYFTFYQDG